MSPNPPPQPSARSTEATARPPHPSIRVAHLIDGRHFGGAEQMVRRLVKAAPPRGIQAWAYCLSEGRLADYLRADGLAIEVFPGSGRFDPWPLFAMVRSARADGIQIIQGHTSRTHLMARLISKSLGIPNITTIHSPIAADENRSVRRHPIRAWVERMGRPWTDHIVPVSHEETERLEQAEGVDPQKLTWIPNGMEPVAPEEPTTRRQVLNQWLATQRLDPEAFTIVMIAQMRPRKGPETLLRAMASWRASGGIGNLILIGDDEFTEGAGYLDSLRKMAMEFGIADAVRLPGFIDNPWDLAAGADLFVLPSLFGEGLPLVLLEAMNHQVAIAVSDAAGNRELLASGPIGWLFPPSDHEALAVCLAEAAMDRQATHKRGQAGRRLFLERYAISHVASQYRRLYESLLAGCENP